jgi:hypothetical protein
MRDRVRVETDLILGLKTGSKGSGTKYHGGVLRQRGPDKVRSAGRFRWVNVRARPQAGFASA